jgi:phosphoribosyl 1,2-cyclic phosphodiesterase
VDAGFGRKETLKRLAASGEPVERCDGILVSHEHTDHINGLASLALRFKASIYITAATKAAVNWNPRLLRDGRFDLIAPGEKFTVGDIEIWPFAIPHDAVDPVAFTCEAEGIKAGVVTDLGCIPEMVKQHVRGCHCLVFESNHDPEMLRVGPYPWHIKQRVMSRHGHLSNHTTATFLTQDYDGAAEILVLAHLSETNNHPEIARLTAQEALTRRLTTPPDDIASREAERLNALGPLFAALAAKRDAPQLHLATQSAPTPVFQF